MELALLVQELFTLLLRLHLRREAFGDQETIPLCRVGRACHPLLLEVEFSRQVRVSPVHTPHTLLRCGELDTINMTLFDQFLLETLTPPPQLRHGGRLGLCCLPRTPLGGHYE